MDEWGRANLGIFLEEREFSTLRTKSQSQDRHFVFLYKLWQTLFDKFPFLVRVSVILTLS
jgi:hypothetical protein